MSIIKVLITSGWRWIEVGCLWDRRTPCSLWRTPSLPYSSCTRDHDPGNLSRSNIPKWIFPVDTTWELNRTGNCSNQDWLTLMWTDVPLITREITSELFLNSARFDWRRSPSPITRKIPLSASCFHFWNINSGFYLSWCLTHQKEGFQGRSMNDKPTELGAGQVF